MYCHAQTHHSPPAARPGGSAHHQVPASVGSPELEAEGGFPNWALSSDDLGQDLFLASFCTRLPSRPRQDAPHLPRAPRAASTQHWRCPHVPGSSLPPSEFPSSRRLPCFPDGRFSNSGSSHPQIIEALGKATGFQKLSTACCVCVFSGEKIPNSCQIPNVQSMLLYQFRWNGHRFTWDVFCLPVAPSPGPQGLGVRLFWV